MSWLATIPLLLFAVVLAFGPGYAMGWALRVPARLRVFYAPLLTFAWWLSLRLCWVRPVFRGA